MESWAWGLKETSCPKIPVRASPMRSPQLWTLLSCSQLHYGNLMRSAHEPKFPGRRQMQTRGSQLGVPEAPGRNPKGHSNGFLMLF